MTTTTKKYSGTSRLIHWIMAVLILGMIVVGFLMVQDGWSRPVQNTMFISHKNIGVLLLILIFVRLFNRWRNPPNLAPVELDSMQEFAARIAHFGLYALLLVMPLAGYIRVRAGGFPIEALDALGMPTLVPRSEALAEAAKMVHFYGAYAITALVVMHIGAACFHGLVRKDGVFTRMWPPVGKGA
ncbi:cytochrome b [Cognatiyoonia sp. IB215446]|uniref:cytochrome b n=1 Tax=Cognatiyoonia sp. IB215446 TaxID=3097355 RepID=UPI002A13EE0B|nr:cytochrome b [Cognatiyoonia sp. IB215446]MDX8349419.1 cytochrome b [Cognatiyoonia sp. IB215446]